MTDVTKLRTIQQLSAELAPTGGFSVPSLRWLVFNAEQNGLKPAVVRIGRRVFIDTARFNTWLESQRKQNAA